MIEVAIVSTYAIRITHYLLENNIVRKEALTTKDFNCENSVKIIVTSRNLGSSAKSYEEYFVVIDACRCGL